MEQPQMQDLAQKPSEEITIEKIRDQIFDSILFENVLSAYEKDLQDTGYAPEQIQEFFSIINNISEENQRKILAFPFEQRQILFKNYLEKIENEKVSISNLVQKMNELALDYEYDFGFHVTNMKIKKDVNRDNRVVWTIKGLEKDHRDNDLPMAFYSKQYRHLYGKKGYQYIYTVRSIPEHRTDGNWFRAPALSIISELQIDPNKLVDKIQTELQKRKQGAH